MSTKLPRHADVDSRILDVDNPLGLFWRVVFACALFIVLSAWVGLLGLWASGIMAFNAWHYLWVPLLGLAVIILVPSALMLAKIAHNILNMLAKTVEAWAHRAGYSIDINRDGYIGYYDLQPVVDDVRQPMIFNSPAGTKLLAKDASVALAGPEPAEVTAEDITPIKRRLIHLPNGTRIPAETIEMVLTELYDKERGLGRNHWVPKLLEREAYDGIMALFCQARLVVGRKGRYAGKLSIKTFDEARKALGSLLEPLG